MAQRPRGRGQRPRNALPEHLAAGRCGPAWPAVEVEQVKIAPEAGQDGRAGRVGRVGRVGRALEDASPIKETTEFLTDYVALPELAPTVIATWIGAAWMHRVWDRFPHLAITSPEKRCGKTTLLDILHVLVPRPLSTSNISPAALYRAIEQMKRPTLLLDEAQSLSRAGSEASEVIRELLNAGIGKNAKVIRCGGAKMDKLREYSIYSPKVFAMIGEPDGVLADRSLPVSMRRRTSYDVIKRYRSRDVETRGKEIRERLAGWAKEYKEGAAELYECIEPFEIENDRMAELLLPLQCVSMLAGDGIDELERYAASLVPVLGRVSICKGNI